MSTEIIEAQQTAVAAPTDPAPAGSPMAMAIAALQSGMTAEQIGQMMDLQDRYNANQAKKLFDEAFAAFKAEAVSIRKGKETTNGPLAGRKYAVLDDVVRAVTPALSRHGLSSSWKLTVDDKDWMEVTCYLRHVGGHQESVSMGGPPDDGAGRNKIQARASTKTYLERYTLKAITGLSERDDDDDGAGGAASEDAMLDWQAAIDAAQTVDDLEKIRRDGVKAFKLAEDYRTFMGFVQTRLKAIKKEASHA